MMPARRPQFLSGPAQGAGEVRRGPGFMARAYRVADPSIATASPGSPIPFLLSSPGVKRDGINLATLPFLLDNYVKNPVVLPFHSWFDFSIGRGLIEIIDSAAGQSLYAEASFDVDDPIGALADRKYRGGFMFAVSLGWDDVDSNGVPVRVSKKKPVARDVLEFSVVSIPGDADALMDGGGRVWRWDEAELKTTRSFLVQGRGLLVATDPRADALEDALQRLAACDGDECAVPLADARRLLENDESPAAGGDNVQGPDEPPSQDGEAPTDEASVEVRRRVAKAAMVAAVWVDEGDEADDQMRERARRALLPEYRRLKMVPPPQLDAALFAGLPLQRKMALFGNGELEEYDMPVLSASGQRVGKKFSGSTRSKMEGILADLKSAMKKQQALLDEADDDSGERVAGAGQRCTCGGHAAAEPEQEAETDSRALLDEALTALSALYPDVEIRVEERAAAPRATVKGAARQVADVSVVQVAADPSEESYSSGSVVLPDKVQDYLRQKMIAKLEAGPDGTETMMWFSKWTDDPDWPITPTARLGVDVIDSIPDNVMSLLKALAAGADESILDIDGVLASDPDWTDGSAPAADAPAADAPPADAPADTTTTDTTASADEPQTLTIDELLAQWVPLAAAAQA